MEEKKFNQKKFRELLKKGIGLRTQKEFAVQAGMSPATINRMLNEDVIARPKIKTLETLASHMHNVSYSELMDACGYETPGIEEVVRSLESDISDFFAFSDGISFFPSMEEMLERLRSFIQRDGVQIVRANGKENTGDDIPEDVKEKGAEEKTTVSIEWRYNNCECNTEFHVYYILTKGDKVIIVDNDIDKLFEAPAGTKETYIQHTAIVSTKYSPAALRLLENIFGGVLPGVDVEILPATYAGYGFEVKGTPEGFVDFLNLHSDTFCDCEENTQLYRRVVEGEDPEEVFREYGNSAFAVGPCGVIADIMKKETEEEYMYYTEDDRLPQDMRNACIMNRAEYDFIEPLSNDTKYYLYECARTLKLPTFGVVYYNTTIQKAVCWQYNTETFEA
ncbi:MAG: helix-turn-helix transcriptional regulator [Lachnospiraceae bacterium]|nr:helix-turn-helix transcriptional regulator [Lachnospiraceae bacterium]